MMFLEFFVWISVVIALVFAGYMAWTLKKKPEGNDKMKEISGIIHNGALTYLNKQYKILSVFVVVMAIILLVLIGKETAASFVLGAVFSALTGNIGMRIATRSNAKTTEGCRKSLNEGLRIAFSSGTVMGMSVVGLGLLGVAFLYIVFGDPQIIYGFGFGASSIALFARVGGGIFTKAADVGADLVGKVEKGIPEDDPRNPAVIADNVGDNVGDIAGMGADLFESYVNSIIAAMALGMIFSSFQGAILPLALAGLGIIASVIGTFLVRTGEKTQVKGAISAFNRGIYASSAIMLVFSYFIIIYAGAQIGVWYATIAGLVAGVAIGLATEYYTSKDKRPAQSIAEASQTGAGTTIITGLAVGMKSTLIPVLAVGASILIAYQFAGMYGIAIAAVGMLSTLGITLATDTYGPVADNSAGIAEMSGLRGEVRERAENLDAVGNTTAAMGKGFAIASAALTALVLFIAYAQTFGLENMSITNPFVVVGLFIGALLPFLFSSFAMSSVGKTAYKIVNEVRRQFKDNGIMSGKKKPDYTRCIEISTQASLREMIVPGSLAIIAPLATGFVLGPAALGGLLAGATATGFLLALMMANSGGARDNAKKFVEDGNFGGKGSDTHKAAVVGDTVGDPFKDTAGPSINILIKLMSIVALVFAPLLI
ncbi:MAG: sodium-translocating pyrophosphatase [Candidatus Aenigmatarchaeota archaeon]